MIQDMNSTLIWGNTNAIKGILKKRKPHGQKRLR